MAESKSIIITVLLSMLMATTSIVLYENIDLTKNAYYCENRIEIGPQYCVRFSSTGARCYPNMENNTGYKDCSIGWTKIEKDTQIPIENTEPDNPSGLGKEICSPPPEFTCRSIN